jgi:hypothetical protein
VSTCHPLQAKVGTKFSQYPHGATSQEAAFFIRGEVSFPLPEVYVLLFPDTRVRGFWKLTLSERNYLAQGKTELLDRITFLHVTNRYTVLLLKTLVDPSMIWEREYELSGSIVTIDTNMECFDILSLIPNRDRALFSSQRHKRPWDPSSLLGSLNCNGVSLSISVQFRRSRTTIVVLPREEQSPTLITYFLSFFCQRWGWYKLTSHLPQNVFNYANCPSYA